MIGLGQIIEYLVPDAILEPNYGEYNVVIRKGIITHWGNALPSQPTAQEIVDAELPAAKTQKTVEVRVEANRRMRLINSAASFDNTALLRGLYLSVEPAARGVFASNIQQLVDIWTPGTAAATAINALATVQLVEAYDVVNDPSWP